MVNSRLGNFNCGPSCEGRTLLLTYGRFFAEFLEDLSLVRLALLELNTCVGLRYGSNVFMLRGFSWKRAPLNLFQPRPPHFHTARNYCADFPTQHPHSTNPNPIMGLRYNSPSPRRNTLKSWNINHVSIACGICHRLRPD